MGLMMDSASSGPLGAAILWIVGLLSGSLALEVAVIAVAGIGFLALEGRIELRRAAAVIIGCFLIFAASRIASGFYGTILGGSSTSGSRLAAASPSPLAASPPITAQPYDPYAGAALPRR